MMCPCARQRQRHDHPQHRMMTKAKPLPDLQILLDLFDCNLQTGSLVWKDNEDKRIPAGKAAGWLGKTGYMVVGVKIAGKRLHFFQHRIIWYIATGNDPLDSRIDHIDGNPLNNKFQNLRMASQAENGQNAKKRCDNSSGYKGVNWCKRHNKWAAKIGANNHRKHLGYYPTPELAHMAYCKAAAELHGEFARAA